MSKLNCYQKLCNVAISCLILIAVQGCQVTKVPDRPNAIKSRISKQAMLRKANQNLKLASNLPEEEASFYYLESADIFLDNNEVIQANEAFNQVQWVTPGSNNEAYKRIIMAKMALVKREPQRAIKLLNVVFNVDQLPNDLKEKYHRTRKEALQLQGSTIEAVRQAIELAKYIEDQKLKQHEHKKIWNLLSDFTPNSLAILQRNIADPELSGWIGFTYLTKQYDLSPDELEKSIYLWRQKYPEHPADTLISSVLIKKYENNYQVKTKTEEKNSDFKSHTPQNIALVLPLSGKHQKTANAIKSGFLSAHYSKQENKAVNISIIDSDKYSHVREIYSELQDKSIDFVVGPLIKADVEYLSKTSIKIPTLALNTLNSSRHSKNLIQFGLPAENEATAVADKASDDGHKKAIIIVPNNEWGKRLNKAFSKRFKQRGGSIVATHKLSPKQSELSSGIKSVLGVTASESRARELRRIGLKFNFKPRRRQDADLAFLATHPNLARQIKPLFNFYYAEKIPIYASSSIFSGDKSDARDHDLNGVIFCDMPWMLDKTIAKRTLHKQIVKLWPEDHHHNARLYAFGIDAYRIANNIERLTLLPEFGVSGMTGILTLNHNNQINRKLLWARFTDGKPKLIS